MTSINPINVNASGVNARTGFGAAAKDEKELETKKEVQTSAGNEKSAVSADKVLDFLAAGSTAFVAKKTVDPSKYVDEASKARIEAFMHGFEDTVATNLSAISKEFPGMSEGAKNVLALKRTEQQI